MILKNKIIAAALVMGTLSITGAALANESSKKARLPLSKWDSRPAAQSTEDLPPRQSQDGQKNLQRPEPPKDGKRKPPVSGDIRGGKPRSKPGDGKTPPEKPKGDKRPEPPKDGKKPPLPPKDAKDKQGN
ncbi:MAG: hypothetical protein IJU98_09945 [Synergistaceae bacterium]|nr:hypothetical protein [Synergistaceae bacterium]